VRRTDRFHFSSGDRTQMNKVARDATRAALLILFGLCCIAAVPFALLLSIPNLTHDGEDVSTLLLPSFVGYLIVGIVTILTLRKSPRLAQSGLVVLGISWLIACFAMTDIMAFHAGNEPWFRFIWQRQ
jgi:hypothetical protein